MPPLLRLLRPHQWTKNLACLAGVVFGGRITEPHAIAMGVAIAAAFSLAASAMYVFNDIQDIDRDRRHPKKRLRPLASGQVNLYVAYGMMLVLVIAAIGMAAWLGERSLFCLLLYIPINLSYSLYLKHQAIFDVSCIAVGFVLRLLAGIYVVGDIPTAWIALCTFSLALFLGFAKRRAELSDLLLDVDSGLSGSGIQSKARSQRPVLEQYTVPFLDSLVNSTATMTVMCYALFTTTSGKNPSLVITVPVVHYAVMHYKYLIMVQRGADEPDRVFLTDARIGMSILLWLVGYLGIVYGNLNFFR